MDEGSTTASPPDYYALLGVAENADGQAIQAAYRALAKQHHPDLASDGKSQSADRFLQIREAYEVLRDATRRVRYDVERRRREAMEEARRLQREIEEKHAQLAASPGSRAGMLPIPVLGPPRKAARLSSLIFLGAILFVVLAIGLIVDRQRLMNVAARQDQGTAVDSAPVPPPLPPLPSEEAARPGDKPGDKKEAVAVPPGLVALSKEVDELSRLRASRVATSRSKAEAKTEEQSPGKGTEKKAAAPTQALSSTSPAPSPAGQPSTDANRKVDCSGEGRSFFVVRQDGVVSVSYNGGPMMRPTIHDQGAGLIIVSMVEPTNRISLGFMKGDKDGTVVLISDAVGNVFRTFGVDCSAAAF